MYQHYKNRIQYVVIVVTSKLKVLLILKDLWFQVKGKSEVYKFQYENHPRQIRN